MTAAVTEHPRFFPSHADALTSDDFETASIRSAAPSYSETKQLHGSQRARTRNKNTS
ncbi:hypothetical protein CH063_12298 [Colletotrichum higginsianum]|uniref:Uncharacterized protein n=1 Tax=Colletotrichum higginsianum (strain IMI 349063) TaxID=759273 RepID=H1VPU2_COLHI|nr:hypothetical protein CH063_12298 [Colletotrichum higginsianum]